MDGIEGGARTASWRGPGGIGLLWASLVPLLLVLYPYGGLVQDARIYIGRGVADRDPLGVGRDIMFAQDGQTGFSLMRGIVDAALRFASPGTISLALALLGGLLWLTGATALVRTLARGRVAWAAAVCALTLPASYGAWNVFRYAEAIATPRTFAQAAVLGGLAAVTADRRRLGAGFLVLAAIFHPLIALPGLAVAGAMQVRNERRWLLAGGAAGAGVAAAVVLGLPPLDRLIQPMDAAWLEILRARSTYLFPSLWPASSFGPIVGQIATVAVAAAFSPARVRRLLLATLAISVGGLALSWILGDLFAVTLVVQVQLWRALWLLAFFGNAALPLAATAVWGRGEGARLILATLVLTRLSGDDLPVASALATLTLALTAMVLRGTMPRVSRLVLVCAAGAAGALALARTIDAGALASALFRSAEAEDGAVSWPMMVGFGLHAVPLAAGAVALALLPGWRPGRAARLAGGAAALCGLAAAAFLWDARPAERRFAELAGGDPALRAAVGSSPGEVLWVDEDSENWFLLGRPAFFNSAQAGPILFSRDLALEWADRSALLLRLGLARPEDARPWADLRRSAAPLALTSDGVRRFCADGRRPAAVVAPGDQRAAVPAGFEDALWRSPAPVRKLTVDDEAIHWRVTDLFTVIRCPDAPPRGALPDGSARSGDARPSG